MAKGLESSHDFDYSFDTVLVYLMAILIYKRKHNRKSLAVVVSAVVVLKRGVNRWKQRRLTEVDWRCALCNATNAKDVHMCHVCAMPRGQHGGSSPPRRGSLKLSGINSEVMGFLGR